jgi:hypothetical protein
MDLLAVLPTVEYRGSHDEEIDFEVKENETVAHHS